MKWKTVILPLQDLSFEAGEIFHEGKFTFEIVDMDGNHIDKILVTVNEEDANKLDLESKED